MRKSRARSVFFLPAVETRAPMVWQPQIDIYRSPEGWVIKLEVAGVRPQDVSITVRDSQLCISGVRHDQLVEEGWSHYTMEIAYNRFERTVALPCDLKHASITVEGRDRMGPWRFLCFYLLCGFTAGLVHWFTNLHSTIPTVGASGAIAGVMGAYLFLFPYSQVVVLVPIFFFPFFFEVPAVIYLGFWALSQVLSGTLALALAGPENVGGVAWWAHVGGFIAGLVLHFFFVRRGEAYRLPARDEYVMENAWVPANYWRDAR